MRVWDIPPSKLCRKHLLGEHRELHAIWNILTKNKRGYSKHPETIRWKGKLKALYNRHDLLVREMKVRGYTHKSPLNKAFATGKAAQNVYVHTPAEQLLILKKKSCDCNV